jgi:hypothetical protein
MTKQQGDLMDRAFVSSFEGPCDLLYNGEVVGRYENGAAGWDAWQAHPRWWECQLRPQESAAELALRAKLAEMFGTLMRGAQDSADRMLSEALERWPAP